MSTLSHITQLKYSRNSHFLYPPDKFICYYLGFMSTVVLYDYKFSMSRVLPLFSLRQIDHKERIDPILHLGPQFQPQSQPQPQPQLYHASIFHPSLFINFLSGFQDGFRLFSVSFAMTDS